ncbi:E3 ubiquitin-protein ligase AIRP2 isoform X1 [Carya illinoinensis]|uniref:E3 ubiquitin-protein ligase AIRP2 isoform X1 n=1 Tax=Carya illinoinensis TaxID=32201 RepID=UPI001C722E63|nr:E3 ubiquitin-protein ligase AIRP2 isoform X1 [Carya illinoinensis]
MRKSFKDSLKALEADIQFANTLASEYPREYDGACLQMRLSYCPAAHFLLFLVQWTDCHLAGALGLLRILIYKAYEDGKTTMYIHERKASLKDFYGVIFPSLLQLQRGITDVEERKQREICATKYKRKDETDKGKLSEIDLEREEECSICMEMNSKVVLPICNHSMCMKCYRVWYAICHNLLGFIIIYVFQSSALCYPMTTMKDLLLIYEMGTKKKKKNQTFHSVFLTGEWETNLKQII